jgi:hypothetical protein
MFVLMHIESTRYLAILARGDYRAGTGLRDDVDQRCGVVGLVGNHGLCRHAREDALGLRHIVGLTRRQCPTGQTAQTFDQRMNLGAQSAPRAPERLIAVFFAAPAACWWARTMVESRKTSSKSASLASSSNTRCHTPLSDQRAKRLYTLFQGPKALGRSRQGEPVRAIHKTASTNRRLSAPVRPGSLTLPGSSASIRFHCSSRNIFRGIVPTPSVSWNDSLTLNVNRP